MFFKLDISQTKLHYCAGKVNLTISSIAGGRGFVKVVGVCDISGVGVNSP